MTDTAGAWDADKLAEFQAVVKRADGGDQTALPIVKYVFDGVPRVWDAFGDLASTAEKALIEVTAGKSELTRLALVRQLAAMRSDLAGHDPSPLERLLVQRVVACWLQSQQADLAYARSLNGSSPSEAEHCQRRQDRAARLYLKALRTLATVRKLLNSSTHINVAERQVNVASLNVSLERHD